MLSLVESYRSFEDIVAEEMVDLGIEKKDLPKLITKLEKDMHKAAKILDFERAAEIRDQLKKLREMIKMTNYKYYLDNGIFDIQNGRFQNGIDNINKSLELKNDWEIPFFYRAVAYQALENYDEAILDYTKALQLNEKMTDAYYNRAKILLSRKDIKNPDINRAVSDLEKALEFDPNFVEALYAMAAAQKNSKIIPKH